MRGGPSFSLPVVEGCREVNQEPRGVWNPAGGYHGPMSPALNPLRGPLLRRLCFVPALGLLAVSFLAMPVARAADRPTQHGSAPPRAPLTAPPSEAPADVVACGDSEPAAACVARLRQVLRHELAPGGTPLPTTCPALPSESCVGFEDCQPPVMQALLALSGLEGKAKAALPEIVSAAHSSNAEVRRIATAVLLPLAPARALPFLKAQFKSPDLQCRRSALYVLGGAADRSELGREVGRALAPSLVPFLTSEDWDDRLDAAQLLARYPVPALAPTLVHALSTQPYEVQGYAAEALGHLGVAGKSALPTLVRLASDHWSARVRKRAASAATTLSGSRVVARAASCASVLEKQGALWQGTLRGAEVRLTALPASSPQRSPGCPVPDGAPREISTLKSHGDCLTGLDAGEFGGEVQVLHGNQRTSLLRGPWLRVARLVEAGDDVWVLTHDSQLSHPRAPLVRLHFDSKGGWSAKQIDRLPGEPQGFGLDGAGRLLILVKALGESCPGKDAMSVLAVSADGRIESLP